MLMPTQVDATVNMYNPVIADSSNHQPLPTLSQLDEVHTAYVLRIPLNIITNIWISDLSG